MFALRWPRLAEQFDAALREPSAARFADEDHTRGAESIRVVGTARMRLDDERAATRVGRERLGLDEPWLVLPGLRPGSAPGPAVQAR